MITPWLLGLMGSIAMVITVIYICTTTKDEKGKDKEEKKERRVKMNHYICEDCGQKYCGWAISEICQKCGKVLKEITREEFYRKPS